jgi:hypothetical protein
MFEQKKKKILTSLSKNDATLSYFFYIWSNTIFSVFTENFKPTFKFEFLSNILIFEVNCFSLKSVKFFGLLTASLNKI